MRSRSIKVRSDLGFAVDVEVALEEDVAISAASPFLKPSPGSSFALSDSSTDSAYTTRTQRKGSARARRRAPTPSLERDEIMARTESLPAQAAATRRRSSRWHSLKPVWALLAVVLAVLAFSATGAHAQQKDDVRTCSRVPARTTD